MACILGWASHNAELRVSDSGLRACVGWGVLKIWAFKVISNRLWVYLECVV